MLLGIIPAVYALVAYTVATTTDVFDPGSRLKFAVLYATLALVSGVLDYYRLKFDQQTQAWLAPRPFVRAVLRGHLVTLLFIAFGAGLTFLFDIDTGWPLVFALMCGPVTGRALTLFVEYTTSAVSNAASILAGVCGMFFILFLALAFIRGR
jgi:hypothetical protein